VYSFYRKLVKVQNKKKNTKKKKRNFFVLSVWVTPKRWNRTTLCVLGMWSGWLLTQVSNSNDNQMGSSDCAWSFNDLITFQIQTFYFLKKKKMNSRCVMIITASDEKNITAKRPKSETVRNFYFRQLPQTHFEFFSSLSLCVTLEQQIER
jgi:hypothetical protein